MPRDQRRAQLLDAANDVFTTKGYHAAAMDDIAEAAGVSKPVLYQHFPSKLDLYLALLDASCDRLVEVVEEALDSTEENADRVVATMGAFYEFVSSASGEFRFVFESDLTGDGQVQQRLWRVNNDIADAIAVVIGDDTGLPDGAVQAAGHLAGRHRPGQRPLLGLRRHPADRPGRGQAAGQQPGLARHQRLPDREPSSRSRGDVLMAGHLLVRRPSPATGRGRADPPGARPGRSRARAAAVAGLRRRVRRARLDGAGDRSGRRAPGRRVRRGHRGGVRRSRGADLPGRGSRRGEVATTEAALAALPDGPRLEVARIDEPGHLDGGDVLKIGRTAYVGLTARTDEAGIAQLTALLEPRGWQVVAVPVTKVLHLKSGVTALPDGTVVGFPPLVDDPTRTRIPGRSPRSTAPRWWTSVTATRP